MAEIRPYREGDLAALYRICLATGDSGADASHLYEDPELIGHLYAAPYGVLSPMTAFVVEDEAGVGGYILGALDSNGFEDAAEAKWWPRLRARYADPGGVPRVEWPRDELLRWLIHHPRRTPGRIALPYPSHLHIDLLPRLQGQGLGRRLLDLWFATVREMGSKGAHLGVSEANVRAIGFYRAYGLSEPSLLRPPPRGVLWFAKAL